MIYPEENSAKIEKINKEIKVNKKLYITASTISILEGLLALHHFNLGENIGLIENTASAIAMGIFAAGIYKRNQINNKAKQEFEQIDLENENKYRINELRTNVEQNKNSVMMFTGASSSFALATLANIILASNGNITTLTGALLSGATTILGLIAVSEYKKSLNSNQRKLEIAEYVESINKTPTEEMKISLK